MTKFLALMALFPLAVLAAGGPNDNGTPVTAKPMLASYAFTGTVGPGTQDGRIFRDAIPGACPTNKVYPGNFGVGTTFNYSAHTLYNNGPAQCVTVNFNPETAGANPCGTNAHISAYLDSYNPANQSANFLGDVGSSLAQPFSFVAPTNSRIILVVTNTSSAAACSYAFSSAELNGEQVIEVPMPIPALDWKLLLVSALLLAGVAVVVRRGKRQA